MTPGESNGMVSVTFKSLVCSMGRLLGREIKKAPDVAIRGQSANRFTQRLLLAPGVEGVIKIVEEGADRSRV
jgi:hypothetical protein